MFRTGALYVLGAWLMLQVADVLFPGFGIPETAIQSLVWAAVLGFPVVLVFGWRYDIGPQGIRRTAQATAEDALSGHQPLARSDYLILLAFAAIAAVLVFRAVHDIRGTPLAASPQAAASDVHEEGERLENSIAVLPFANISNDPDNEYFCDGVSEEILDRLAGFGELNVIGRTSSFAFKGSDYGIDRISELLRVRYVLQGSVRKAGAQLRISAQLLDAGGRQVWNQSFDRELSNIFEIQSEIAAAVATTVASRVTAQPDTGHQPNLEAYDHYLPGRALLHRRDAQHARAEFARAIELDPEFAEAAAELGIAIALTDDLDRAREVLQRAQQLNPRLLRTRAAQGYVLMADERPDLAGSERELRGVLVQDPNMSDALLWLHNNLVLQQRNGEARQILERAALIDPLHPSIVANLVSDLLEEGQISEAQRSYERLLAQPTPGLFALSTAAGFYGSTGQLEKSTALSRQVTLSEPSFSNLFFLLQDTAVLGDWELADALNDRLLAVRPQGPGRIYRRVILPAIKDDTKLALQRLHEAFDDLGLKLADLDPFSKVIAGVHLARGGDYAAAIEVLEPVVDIEAPYNVDGAPYMSPPAHSLAWAYLHTGTDAKAARVLTAASRECSTWRADGRGHGSGRLQYCAEAELLRGNVDAALEGLDLAFQAGWRGYYVQERDPYWVSVASDPRYRALMAKVKADVDQQRAAVQQVESNDVFLGKLDAAIAAAASQ